MTEESKHRLELCDRQRLSMTGVARVDNYDEQRVVAETSLGIVTVTGGGMSVEHLDLASGRLVVVGDNIESVSYSVTSNRGKSFWRRLVK